MAPAAKDSLSHYLLEVTLKILCVARQPITALLPAEWRVVSPLNWSHQSVHLNHIGDTTGGQSKTFQKTSKTSGSVLSLQLCINIDKMITFVVVAQNKFFCGKL